MINRCFQFTSLSRANDFITGHRLHFQFKGPSKEEQEEDEKKKGREEGREMILLLGTCHLLKLKILKRATRARRIKKTDAAVKVQAQEKREEDRVGGRGGSDDTVFGKDTK